MRILLSPFLLTVLAALAAFPAPAGAAGPPGGLSQRVFGGPDSLRLVASPSAAEDSELVRARPDRRRMEEVPAAGSSRVEWRNANPERASRQPVPGVPRGAHTELGLETRAEPERGTTPAPFPGPPGGLSPSLEQRAGSHPAVLRGDPRRAAVAGGVLGAATGLTWMHVRCRKRFCEMGELVGLLGGAVVGGAVGYVLAGGGPPTGR